MCYWLLLQRYVCESRTILCELLQRTFQRNLAFGVCQSDKPMRYHGYSLYDVVPDFAIRLLY